jgi:hypothetical protein
VSAATRAAIRPEPKTVNGFAPSTFLERGVAVPCTTPQLAGARARPGDRKPLELIVPSPAGGRGVYIMSWDDVPVLYTLTVHDRRLIEAVTKLRGVTPGGIRLMAREVAAEGLAGRGALTAARKAKEDEDLACLKANFDLLLELVRQTEPKELNLVPPAQDNPENLARRGRHAVARVARRLGRSAEAVVEALEQLATIFGNIGIGHDARIPTEIAALTRVRGEVAAYAKSHPDDDGSEARMVADVAHLTVHMANAALADARALSGDIAGLLQRWATAPDPLAQFVARPDWLLDGWDRICALWDMAPSVGSTLTEMATLVPVVPREADDWLSHQLKWMDDVPRHHHRRRLVQQLEDWRTGYMIHDVIARNELLLEKTL